MLGLIWHVFSPKKRLGRDALGMQKLLLSLGKIILSSFEAVARREGSESEYTEDF